MFKRKTTTALVIPPTLEQHPSWLERTGQLHHLQAVAGQLEAAVRQLEDEAAEARSVLDDIRVGVLLGDTASAVSAEDQKARIAETDRRLEEAQDQLGAARKAVRRLEQQCAERRGEINADIREAVDRTHRDLCEQLADQIQGMQPTLTALRSLRGAHPSAFEHSRVPTWSELLLALPGSKAGAWAREVQALGIDVG
jgi:chromosome segregation ATPase